MEFLCENSGAGLSAVDVLSATGEHDVFLEYLQEFDPEGHQILTDPALSDKTIWAPTDDAFAKLGDAPRNASPADIKAVLGYHITPPRRTPDGDYPIVTFDYLADGGQIIHQTRTGILSESDQRVRTRVQDGVFTVQDVRIGTTAWCTQAGSIFSIDEVITEVATPGWLERS
ncbi:fasciclin domain-containing protein, partial [bacterium]|nr:fasciclin domain-containing protein [bacterium]